jgi:hypothetical protein
MKKWIMSEVKNAVGKFVVMWNSLSQNSEVSLIVKLDKKAQRITYEYLTGPHKGRVLTSRYDGQQAVDFYDDKKEAMRSLRRRTVAKKPAPKKAEPKRFRRGQVVWVAGHRLEPVVCDCCKQVKYHKAVPVVNKFRVKEEHPASVFLIRGKQVFGFQKDTPCKAKADAMVKARLTALNASFSNLRAYMEKINMPIGKG